MSIDDAIALPQPGALRGRRARAAGASTVTPAPSALDPVRAGRDRGPRAAARGRVGLARLADDMAAAARHPKRNLACPPALKIEEQDPDPKNPWGDDVLDRKEIADRLTSIVRGQEVPFVISVDGRWGTGKTFLLKRWAQDLRNQDPRWQAIYYNAWEDDFSRRPAARHHRAALRALREGNLAGNGPRVGTVWGSRSGGPRGATNAIWSHLGLAPGCGSGSCGGRQAPPESLRRLPRTTRYNRRLPTAPRATGCRSPG